LQLKKDYQDEMSPEQWRDFLDLGVKVDKVEVPNDPNVKAFLEYLGSRQ